MMARCPPLLLDLCGHPRGHFSLKWRTCGWSLAERTDWRGAVLKPPPLTGTGALPRSLSLSLAAEGAPASVPQVPMGIF
jgi:hypothetical protein